MENLKEMKQWLKENGALISETRKEHKNKQRTNGYGLDGKLLDLKHEYRHNHIAYSMARGKDYKNIETKVRKGNEPDWYIINELLLRITPEEITEEAS